MPELAHVDFPTAVYLEGGVTDDGQAVLVRLFTADKVPIQFSVKNIDLEDLLTFFLRMASSVAHGTAEDRVQYQPIPISAVSAGELADGSGCLGVTLGSTELMFQMPLAQMSQLAQNLLIVGTPNDRSRMS
jgi:hypothetical protein